MYRIIFTFLAALHIFSLSAAVDTLPSNNAPREELIPYGDMESWTIRNIEESGIIGGESKSLYEIAPNQTLNGDEPYTNAGGSPWATSNVMARVMGITKTSCSVFPDITAHGKVVNLVTRIEKVKVLGLINITVLASGSIFLGSVLEPIKGTSEPHSMLNSGIEFNKRPTGLRFDYKVKLSGEPNRELITGFGSRKTVEGIDMPVVIVLLQKRWEDKEGGLHASRIGTRIIQFKENSDWEYNASYSIIYGDATQSPEYDPCMALAHDERYALNSRGENVPVVEECWGGADETPTHLILQFSSSHGGAYLGSPGNQLSIDNVRLLY